MKRGARVEAQRIVWQAASLGLSYPDRELLDRADLIRQALAQGAPGAAGHFSELLDGWQQKPLAQLQADYVELFDLSRKQTLYLSYWTDGDTRRRGEVLAEVKQFYRRSGFLVNLRGELPDYLPVVLEYAAMIGPKDGIGLLQRYRASLELIRLALAERSAAYSAVLQAVCKTLPGVSPADRQAALAMARSGPPREAVGLDPYDPRLLPFVDSATR
jgi:nitrate reductase delta subunit